MICDDCGLESGNGGNHFTDAECMAALIIDRNRLLQLLTPQMCKCPEVKLKGGETAKCPWCCEVEEGIERGNKEG